MSYEAVTASAKVARKRLQHLADFAELLALSRLGGDGVDLAKMSRTDRLRHLSEGVRD